MDLLGRVRRRLGRWFHGLERTRLYCHDLTSIPEVDGPEGCLVSLLDACEALLLPGLPRNPSALLNRRLQRGDRCYVARIDGRVAHWSWVQLSGIHLIADAGRTAPVEPGEFWIYHCHTVEWARGRHVYPFVLARILLDGRAAGLAKANIYASSDNLASLRGIARAGFAPVRDWRSLLLLGHAIPLD